MYLDIDLEKTNTTNTMYILTFARVCAELEDFEFSLINCGKAFVHFNL